MTQLRRQMLDELERRNYSANTVRTYIRTVEDLARYFKRRPNRLGPHFSPRGERKCVRGASIRGGRRLARGGVLDCPSSTRDRAQRSSGAPSACFRRQVVRNAG